MTRHREDFTRHEIGPRGSQEIATSASNLRSAGRNYGTIRLPGSENISVSPKTRLRCQTQRHCPHCSFFFSVAMPTSPALTVMRPNFFLILFRFFLFFSLLIGRLSTWCVLATGPVNTGTEKRGGCKETTGVTDPKRRARFSHTTTTLRARLPDLRPIAVDPGHRGETREKMHAERDKCFQLSSSEIGPALVDSKHLASKH